MSKKKEIKKTFKENILDVNFVDEMKESYLNYALEVISERAIPDIRDGLKPVQRRSLYTMEQMGLKYDKAYKKSGRIVGICMGAFHPHG